jgi:hypothetical protein
VREDAVTQQISFGSNCLAESCDVRLFDDFGCYACVVIAEPDGFTKKVEDVISPLEKSS